MAYIFTSNHSWLKEIKIQRRPTKINYFFLITCEALINFRRTHHTSMQISIFLFFFLFCAWTKKNDVKLISKTTSTSILHDIFFNWRWTNTSFRWSLIKASCNKDINLHIYWQGRKSYCPAQNHLNRTKTPCRFLFFNVA
jgi:hypothetical protein